MASPIASTLHDAARPLAIQLEAATVSDSNGLYMLTPLSLFDRVLESLSPDQKTLLFRDWATLIAGNVQRHFEKNSAHGLPVAIADMDGQLVFAALSLETARCGLGNFSIETWGDLLVLRIERSSSSEIDWAHFLEAALQSLGFAEARALHFESDDLVERVAVVSPDALPVIQAAKENGAGLAQVAALFLSSNS